MHFIISLSGMLGSGKSTVGKMLAQKLGYTFYSTGSAQRKIAQERGITTLELNKLSMTDTSIDNQIDGVFKTLVQEEKDFVVDSRLAFFFIPSSFKVKLNIDTKVAAERIFNDKTRTEERAYQSVDEAETDLKTRRALEVERFKNLYHVDIDNEANFDLIIDTTDKTPEEICEKILKYFQKFQKRCYHE
ncbi:MAG: cytidylate kinase family protein [Alphaproteobacteria bacterium]|nr:cytidylate kinase family protein [Alphaproteobacteria bacterium]